MKKMQNNILRVIISSVSVLFLIACPTTAFGQEASEDAAYYRARVTSAHEQSSTGTQVELHDIELEILSGEKKGEDVKVTQSVESEKDIYQEGEKVIIVEMAGMNGFGYYIVDHYRTGSMVVVFILFLLVAIVLARKRAALGLVGLGFSMLILSLYMVPKIADGQSPIIVGLIGAISISVISLYIAHGFNKRTSIALTGMLITIMFGIILAYGAIHFTQLFGVGSEDAAHLLFIQGDKIELRGLLLVGIIIGALGVLDDVTTAIVATAKEIHTANPKLGRKKLYKKVAVVGREHVASMINTLFFAYAGASLPVFLIFSLDQQPFWVTLNSQFIGEEIIRAIIGSITLICAIPITNYFASRHYCRGREQKVAGK